MHTNFVLLSVLAGSLATLAFPRRAKTIETSCASAIDVAVPVSLDSFKCMKNHGYSTAFVRGYAMSEFDTNVINNIRNADLAGLGTEVFMTPQIRSDKKGSQQFEELYEGLKEDNIKVKTVWLQVTSPIDWNPSSRKNIDFINDITKTAKDYGVMIGIYTNAYDWSQITKDATVSGGMLWYWNVDGVGATGETPANFDDFRPFGNFMRPTVKQFGQKENICGVTVNRNVYLFNEPKHFLASAANAMEGYPSGYTWQCLAWRS
ncbi:hypothetical protein Y032_0066g3710 [Ancylostoma ceylanicum]|uniref:Lysozyme n=1 Tax=Ancylostoma ceylanicum TaxID=53326 RepID=A0A016TZS3_9BILA|nr:hypothetical protein Y032_0066g3710 [Ancylostoma ceylanicum]